MARSKYPKGSVLRCACGKEGAVSSISGHRANSRNPECRTAMPVAVGILHTREVVGPFDASDELDQFPLPGPDAPSPPGGWDAYHAQDESTRAVLVDNPLHAAPADGPNPPMPLDEPGRALPADSSYRAEPVDEPGRTSPGDSPHHPAPDDTPYQSGPVDEPNTASPGDVPHQAEPVDLPSRSAPRDQPVHTPPPDGPIRTLPVDEPSRASPGDDLSRAIPIRGDEPGLAAPADAPILTVPDLSGLPPGLARPIDAPRQVSPHDRPRPAHPLDGPNPSRPGDEPTRAEPTPPRAAPRAAASAQRKAAWSATPTTGPVPGQPAQPGYIRDVVDLPIRCRAAYEACCLDPVLAFRGTFSEWLDQMQAMALKAIGAQGVRLVWDALPAQPDPAAVYGALAEYAEVG